MKRAVNDESNRRGGSNIYGLDRRSCFLTSSSESCQEWLVHYELNKDLFLDMPLPTDEGIKRKETFSF
jgi:hypothetical protein